MNHLFDLPKELVSLILDNFINHRYQSLIISLTSEELSKRITYSDKLSDSSSFTEQIASEGQLSLLQYSLSMGCDWDLKGSILAAKNGHFNILQWIVNNNYSCDVNICHYAAEGGHLPIIQWFKSIGYPHQLSGAAAARGGHLHVLQWLHANECL